MSTILIVDDEVRFCRSLCEILEAEQLPATYTTNPQEALDIASSKAVDLVFLDIRMPGLGGMELLEGLRATDPNVPVIINKGPEWFASIGTEKS